MPQSERLLVLLRHGQSEWNLKNLFTGWKDPDLSRWASRKPKRPGGGSRRAASSSTSPTLRPDPRAAHARVDAGRARPDRTARVSRPGAQRTALWRPLRAEQGRRTQEVGRGAGPPVAAQLRRPAARRRKPQGHGRARSALLLSGILPAVLGGKRVLVAAHGNSLRALVMVLDRLTQKTIPTWRSPPACRWSTASRRIRRSNRRKF